MSTSGTVKGFVVFVVTIGANALERCGNELSVTTTFGAHRCLLHTLFAAEMARLAENLDVVVEKPSWADTRIGNAVTQASEAEIVCTRACFALEFTGYKYMLIKNRKMKGLRGQRALFLPSSKKPSGQLHNGGTARLEAHVVQENSLTMQLLHL